MVHQIGLKSVIFRGESVRGCSPAIILIQKSDAGLAPHGLKWRPQWGQMDPNWWLYSPPHRHLNHQVIKSFHSRVSTHTLMGSKIVTAHELTVHKNLHLDTSKASFEIDFYKRTCLVMACKMGTK